MVANTAYKGIVSMNGLFIIQDNIESDQLA